MPPGGAGTTSAMGADGKLLTSRQRVRMALEHREPDRVPIDLAGSSTTSVAVSTYGPLRAFLGLPPDPVTVLDPVQQLPYVGDDLLVALGVDTRSVHPRRGDVAPPFIEDEGEYWSYHDRWGIKLRMPKESPYYFDRVAFPIGAASVEAVDDYRWPQPITPPPGLREVARDLDFRSEYALVGGSYIGIGGIFEQGWKLLGMEEALMGILTEPGFGARLLDRVTDAYIEGADNYLDEVGDYLDVFMFADDVCTQTGWIVSPELYASLIKPRHRRLFDAVRAKTDAKIFYHSCGAVFDLIPHLIEVGVDIVNPVQVSARGMDTRMLKKAYGSDVVFWGGGVDTQHVLPFGTAEDVRAEVERRIDDLAPGGGFVFAAVHNIQALVPPENIVTAFNTALTYGRY